MDYFVWPVPASTRFYQTLIIIKLLEIFKQKISGLKHSQVPTGILQKKCNTIMEKHPKLSDWVNIWITYLLPKLLDNKEIRKYRPIACFSAMYKFITGRITEQRGCRPRGKGCKYKVFLTLVQKCRQGTTTTRCVRAQNRAVLIHLAAVACNMSMSNRTGMKLFSVSWMSSRRGKYLGWRL
jgi:hypothetical protein